MHPHRFHYRLVILGFFLILCLFGLVLITQSQREGKFTSRNAASDQAGGMEKELKIPVLPQASFSVTSMDSEKRVFKEGELMKFTVTATSNNEPVIGYDALVEIKGSEYEVVAVRSLHPDFTILQFVKPTHVTITGIKNPQAKENIVFANTEVAEVVVKANTPGSLQMKVVESVGRESSKVITATEGSSVLQKMSAGSSAPVNLDISR